MSGRSGLETISLRLRYVRPSIRQLPDGLFPFTADNTIDDRRLCEYTLWVHSGMRATDHNRPSQACFEQSGGLHGAVIDAAHGRDPDHLRIKGANLLHVLF